MRGLSALATLGLLLGTSAALADDDDDHSGYPHVYAEDDPKLDEKIRVEKAFGLYLIKPPRRHVSESVELHRNRVTMRYWYSIGPDPEQVACDGMKWVLFGRHQWSGGMRRMLDDTDFVELNLEFIDVLRKRGGGQPGKRDFRRFLELRLSAARLKRVNFPEARHLIEAGSGCGKFMRKHFDRYRFDKRYYKRELKRQSR
jgi:hypothetical protein